jgi:hypothetical protein
MATVETGSTLPTEVTSTGMTFSKTFVTTTGTPGGGGAAALFSVQPETRATVLKTKAQHKFLQELNERITDITAEDSTILS